MTEKPDTPWFTIKEAAHYVKSSERTLRKYVKAGTIPFRRQGLKLIFNRIELDDWMDE